MHEFHVQTLLTQRLACTQICWGGQNVRVKGCLAMRLASGGLAILSLQQPGEATHAIAFFLSCICHNSYLDVVYVLRLALDHDLR